MSPPPGVAATRRTALAGAVGSALALAACDGGEPAATPSPTAATSTTVPPEDPDQALVEQVVAELDELIALTSAAAAARRGVGAWPAAFETMHRAHRDVLTDEEADASEPRVRGSAGEVLDRVTRREEQAQRRFAEWAIAAQSGRLARLLASMSAAVAQQLATPVKAGG